MKCALIEEIDRFLIASWHESRAEEHLSDAENVGLFEADHVRVKTAPFARGQVEAVKADGIFVRRNVLCVRVSGGLTEWDIDKLFIVKSSFSKILGEKKQK